MEEDKKEIEIGQITHYFNKISVAVIELTKGDLSLGETIHIKGHTTDFSQTVDSMQIEHQNVEKAAQGESVGLKVKEPVREGDIVYKIIE